MPLLLAILAAASLAGLILAIRVANRPPHCQVCGVAATATVEEDRGAGPLAVGVTYRCTRCGGAIGRRYYIALCE